MRFADLFCGTGGLSCGLVRSDHELVAGFDAWAPALAVYNRNMPGHAGMPEGSEPGRLTDLSKADGALAALASLPEMPEMLVGGPPCQDFSSANHRRQEAEKANLTPIFARIVAEAGTRFFIMENVPNVLNSQAFATAMETYRTAGYGLTGMVLNSSLCGLPQRRKRFILVGAKDAEDGFLVDHVASLMTLDEMSVRQFWADRGLPLGFDHYYRHPHNYGKKAIFSVDEPSPTIRGINRPVPPRYVEILDEIRTGVRAGEMPKNSVAPFPGMRPMNEEERGVVQGFPNGWDWSPAGSKTVRNLMIGNAVPVGMGELVGRALAAWTKGARPAFRAGASETERATATALAHRLHVDLRRGAPLPDQATMDFEVQDEPEAVMAAEAA